MWTYRNKLHLFLRKRQNKNKNKKPKSTPQNGCIRTLLWLHATLLWIYFIFFDFKIVNQHCITMVIGLWKKAGYFSPLIPPCVNKYGHIVTQTAIFPHLLLNTCLWYHLFLNDNIKRLYCYVCEMSGLLIFA